jgi:hypothetical protein
MEHSLARRVERFSPPWLRYVYTLSEIVRTGEGWVVADGDDIALWDTDAGDVLPLWPAKEFAEEVIDGKAAASTVSPSEIAERLMPYLEKNGAATCLFPNFENDILVEPAAIIEDLSDLIAEPVDIAAQLTAEPVVAIYDEWALLETPEFDDDQPEDWAPNEAPAEVFPGDRYATVLAAAAATGALWLLNDEPEDAVVGIVLDDRPTLAVFATREEAARYAERIDGDSQPVPAGVPSLVDGWLLAAHGGSWGVAISPNAEDAAFVEPTRLALDLAETCSAE